MPTQDEPRRTTRNRRAVPTLLVLLTGLLLPVLGALPAGGAGPAEAATGGSIDAVRQALSSDPVYVDPAAEAADLVDAAALRRSIGDAPIVVAVLPTAARNATNGDVDGLPAAIGGRRAVVVLCGRSLRAAASNAVLPAGRAGALAAAAQRSHAGAFDRTDVNGALTQLVDDLRQEISTNRGSGAGGSTAGSTERTAGDSGGSALPWLLGGLVVVGGGAAYLVSRRRRRAAKERRELDTARAEVNSLYARLGSDVSTLDPGGDAVARQALADASERYTAAGALLSRAQSPQELGAAGHAVGEGLHAARVARQRLGLDPGPPIPEPEPQGGEQLRQPQQVSVGNASYTGYPSYAPGAPYYFPGGMMGGGYVPGGWYGSRFWEGALIGGLAGSVLTGGLGGFGLGGFGGFGLGGVGYGGYGLGYGSGYGSGYESGYDSGYERGLGADGGANGGDWSGDGGYSGGGDWAGGDGGGDWGGGDGGGADFGGGDFGGGDSGGGGGDW